MLEFDLPLTKADQREALVYTLITTLDVLLNSGQVIEEPCCHNLVRKLKPTPSASRLVGKIRSTLVKLAHSDVDSDDLTAVLMEHDYQFAFRKDVDPFKSDVVVSTPHGILTFPLLA
ncbi:hypothetical protein [Companilactobacillus sp.]|uniref:hypothetical protein n=1 Tax=Companilactobacillus sp. TaxID=2767905 RepID=UPI0026302ADA|nr:hypothetical protein [Companilactobacillus sp.]